MRTPKISTNFAPYTDAGLSQKASDILFSMDGNPYFTNPVPALGDIRQVLNEYKEVLAKAVSGDKVSIAIKKETRKKLELMLSQLPLYVMFVANGNEAILLSTAFNLTKTPTPVRIQTPENLRIKNGINPGQLVSCVKAVKGATGYSHEITPHPLTDESVWKSHSFSKRSFTFTNLQPGCLYWIRVAAVGSGGQKTYSRELSQWAQ
jgi:hypothetical protein